MKKIVYAILSVLLILPFAVKADMSGPLIREYDMEVINPDGAQLYDYTVEGEDYVLRPKEGKVPFGTRFTVADDYDGDEYISIGVGYDEETDTYEYDGYIKRKDGRSIVKDFKITEKELGEKYNIIAIQDIEIKEGPSYGYAGTGTIIKKGTKLTARSILAYDDEDKEYHEEWDDPWLYVEYNKTKGYVIAYRGTIGFDMGVKTGITAISIGMYNTSEDEKPFATIPANTVIKCQTYGTDEWDGGYYIEYNGKKGIVYNSYYLIDDEPIEYKVNKDLKVYETLDSDGDDKIISKVVGTVKAGTTGTSKYWWSENWAVYFRYEDKNVKGWIYVPTYDDDDEDYDESVYIDIKYPWDDEEDEEEPLEDEETENPEETDDSSNGSDFQPHIIPRRYYPENNSNNILYICLAAVAVISITTIVIIVLINKKKEQKVEPKQEEVKEIQTEEVKEETKEDVKKEENK